MQRQALNAAQMLATDAGGIDWAGLPLVAEYLGVTDVDGLMHGLQTIRTWQQQQRAEQARQQRRAPNP